MTLWYDFSLESNIRSAELIVHIRVGDSAVNVPITSAVTSLFENGLLNDTTPELSIPATLHVRPADAKRFVDVLGHCPVFMESVAYIINEEPSPEGIRQAFAHLRLCNFLSPGLGKQLRKHFDPHLLVWYLDMAIAQWSRTHCKEQLETVDDFFYVEAESPLDPATCETLRWFPLSSVNALADAYPSDLERTTFLAKRLRHIEVRCKGQTAGYNVMVWVLANCSEMFETMLWYGANRVIVTNTILLGSSHRIAPKSPWRHSKTLRSECTTAISNGSILVSSVSSTHWHQKNGKCIQHTHRRKCVAGLLSLDCVAARICLFSSNYQSFLTM